MPRTKKAPGQAVDSRNGRRAEIQVASLNPFPLPKREGQPCRLETRKAWRALWADSVSSALTVADRPVLIRWAHAIDRAAWAFEQASEEPLSTGSMGQEVESPYYGIADKALRVAAQCEAQLGVGALNRNRLGLTMAAAQKSLLDLNEAFLEGADDEPDARLG